MPFDILIRAVLEDYTNRRPRSESEWYGPWTSILTTFFPVGKGYLVTPQRKIVSDEDHTSVVPDFVIEVSKITTSPLDKRTVLIVEIKNTQHWPDRILALENQLLKQADATLADNAKDLVYYIMTMGPHWRYGVKYDNGRGLQPLIGWRDTIHDENSFRELVRLSERVYDL
jgi:hypothetical protein